MPVPIYNVIFNWFEIFDTRARSQDTDYASLAVSIGKDTQLSSSQFIGNLGNGKYFPPAGTLLYNQLPVGSFQTIFINTTVINHGNGQQGDVEQSLFHTAMKIIDLAAQVAADEIAPDVMALTTELLSTVSTEIGSLLGTFIPVPLVGTAIGALAGWLVGQIGNFIDANCDGVVAAELAALQGGDLWTLTKDGQHNVQTNHVLTSPAGCNTSNYTVSWTVERVNRPFLAAVSDKNGMMHLFSIGTNSEVATQFAMPAAPWNPAGWLSISGGTFNASTPVATLLDPANSIHVFAVGQDGCIWTTQSSERNNWNGGGWVRISSMTFSQQTVVSALLDAAGLMHVFAVGTDGHVYTQTCTPDGNWSTSGWTAVSNGAFTQGTTVTSLLDGSGVIHLFAVGENGQVFTNVAKPGNSWVNGWWPLSTASFSQGTMISALLDKAGAMHLFAVGDDGSVHTQASKSFDQANAAAWAVVQGGSFSIGTPVAALLDKEGLIHLFAVGKDGYVWTQYTVASGGWNPGGWVKLAVGGFNQGTSVSTMVDASGLMHLFAMNPSSSITSTTPPVSDPGIYNAYTNYSKPFQAWNGWTQVSSGVFV